MSTWNYISKDDLSYDPTDNTIDIYIGSDYNGNNYLMIPLETLKTFIEENDIP
jgi:hypothetical protein